MISVSPCVACPSNSLGFCGAVLGNAKGTSTNQTANWQSHLLIPAGRRVVISNERSPDIYVLCHGWGFRFLQLASGRRQILNFLLPGDLFSASSVFEERFHFSVKALTAIQVSRMQRAEVQARLSCNSAVVAALARTCFLETEASDKMIAVLGRKSAEERIAYLLQHLMGRIASQTVIRGNRYPMPLRQKHIADAVGLTSVHVSRILGVFRDRRIADLSNGVLEVIKPDDLERLASVT
jgi:CRP/FNR family transcriptional regulator, anaerobic regulatory protein